MSTTFDTNCCVYLNISDDDDDDDAYYQHPCH